MLKSISWSTCFESCLLICIVDCNNNNNNNIYLHIDRKQSWMAMSSKRKAHCGGMKWEWIDLRIYGATWKREFDVSGESVHWLQIEQSQEGSNFQYKRACDHHHTTAKGNVSVILVPLMPVFLPRVFLTQEQICVLGFQSRAHCATFLAGVLFLCLLSWKWHTGSLGREASPYPSDAKIPLKCLHSKEQGCYLHLKIKTASDVLQIKGVRSVHLFYANRRRFSIQYLSSPTCYWDK